MTGTNSTFDDVTVGNFVNFQSNRDVAVSAVPFDDGQYVNNFTFTSPAATTDLSWTWVTEPEYMYFNYPNMSVAPQPFAFPTARPTFSPSLDDDDQDGCPDDTPCPTHCANGYTSAYTYASTGCTVYCKSAPTYGQCAVGGSGCTSSCRSISVGAIAGIAVGCFVFVAIVVGIIVYFSCCRARPPMTERENEMPSA